MILKLVNYHFITYDLFIIFFINDLIILIISGFFIYLLLSRINRINYDEFYLFHLHLIHLVNFNFSVMVKIMMIIYDVSFMMIGYKQRFKSILDHCFV